MSYLVDLHTLQPTAGKHRWLVDWDATEEASSSSCRHMDKIVHMFQWPAMNVHDAKLAIPPDCVSKLLHSRMEIIDARCITLGLDTIMSVASCRSFLTKTCISSTVCQSC